MIAYDCDYGTGGTTTNIWRPYAVSNTSSSTITVEYNDGLYYKQCTSASTWYDWDYEDAITTGSSWKQAVRVIRGVDSWAQTTGTTNWKVVWNSCDRVRQSPTNRLRDIIRNRQAPYAITSRKHLQPPTDIREVRARETLRRVLGDQKFRSFVKNGFVSVKAKSGLVYQIFPGHDMTKVYKDGQYIEKLCVVLKGQFPPTDSLIMRYLLILNDERDFRKHAIKHGISQPAAPKQIDQRPLTEILKELKVA